MIKCTHQGKKKTDFLKNTANPFKGKYKFEGKGQNGAPGDTHLICWRRERQGGETRGKNPDTVGQQVLYYLSKKKKQVLYYSFEFANKWEKNVIKITALVTIRKWVSRKVFKTAQECGRD